MFTKRIGYYQNDRVVTNVNEMMDFVQRGAGSGDKIVRIIAVNEALYIISKKSDKSYKNSEKLCKYVDGILKDGKYEKLNQIKFSDLRKNCISAAKANPFLDGLSDIWEELDHRQEKVRSERAIFDKIWRFGQLSTFVCAIFIFGPIWLLSKLIQIAYPWIIVGYLSSKGLLFSGDIDTFQLVMLFIYIGLQLLLLFLGVYIGKKQHLLWHIEPGNLWTYWSTIQTQRLLTEAQEFYDECCWYPQATQIVCRAFGDDIGNIIIEYCKSFEISNDNENDQVVTVKLNM